MMAPRHDVPQESAHLHRVPPCLFMYATTVELSVAINTVWS